MSEQNSETESGVVREDNDEVVEKPLAIRIITQITHVEEVPYDKNFYPNCDSLLEAVSYESNLPDHEILEHVGESYQLVDEENIIRLQPYQSTQSSLDMTKESIYIRRVVIPVEASVETNNEAKQD